MYKKVIYSIIEKVQNPGRVRFNFMQDKYIFICSGEKTNDTWDWFHENSEIVESELDNAGFKWCYVFEKTPNANPFIYMFFGENIDKEYIKYEMCTEIKSLPEERDLCFEDCPFKKIDKEKYNKSSSALQDSECEQETNNNEPK